LVSGACLLILLAAVAETGSLVEALNLQPTGRLVELTFDNHLLARGYINVIQADSLVLQAEKDGGQLTIHALADIARLREWRSSTDRGIRWGGVSGAILGGIFGFGLGQLGKSLNDSGTDYDRSVFGITLLGAGAGVFAGGVLGGGVGALINGWYQVWPVDRLTNSRPPPPPPRAQVSRVGLFGGNAHSLLDGYEVNRFAGRVSLRNVLSANFSVGPEFSYHGFNDPIVTHPSSGATGTKIRESLLIFALATTLQARASLVAPYATLGVGWCLSDESFFGAQVGGGLRVHMNRNVDLDFDVRYHFGFADVSADQVDRFWTFGLGLVFDN